MAQAAPPALASDLAGALDPVLMSRRAGINPDDWQQRVLRSGSRRLLLNAARQSGKSTTVATLALHTALYEPKALVLIVSPSERQSGETFRKIVHTYRALGRPVAPTSEGALHLELANGSRVLALPGREETIRSFSGVRLLILDEAARIGDELYRTVRPFLAVSGGRLVALSTPWGKRGWWHMEWTEGGPTWERYEIPAAMCPRIPAAFLEEERASLGPLWFAAEYCCKFTETTAQLFSYDLVHGAITPAVRPFAAQIDWGGAA